MSAATGICRKHPVHESFGKTSPTLGLTFMRIGAYLRNVCSPMEARELSRWTVWQTCVNNALASAVTQINKPRVNALYKHSASRSSAG
jgi:hypothetical protein